MMVLATSANAQWVFNPVTGNEYRLTVGFYWGASDTSASTPPDWWDAEDEAVSYGGHLATINDAAENAWLVSTFGTGSLHIGLTDWGSEGTFYWINGEPVTYTNWDAGQPDNAHAGGEDTTHLNHNGAPFWNDLGAQGNSGNHPNPYQGIVERTAVPEPATFTCLGALLFLVGIRRFRKEDRENSDQMKLKNIIVSIGTFAALLIAFVAPTTPGFAQGGGGTGGGTIFFINGAGGGYNTNYLWSMNSNGSNVAQLGFWGHFNVPSRALHNGHRWHLTTLQIPNETYPNGNPRMEVFAMRDDYDSVLNNNGDTRVQLTNEPSIQPYFGWFQGMHWMPGDAGVSFKARRWVGTEPVEGGLYTATLEYRADGNIIGITSQPTVPSVAFPLDATGSPTFNRFSWGSSSTKVAYTDNPETGIWIADLTSGVKTRIFTGGVGYLDWSQDGTKFVFGSGVIRTMKSNGTGIKNVIAPKYVNGVYVSGFAHAYLNPAGTHITCVGIIHPAGGGTDNDVFRANVSGGSLANLTNSPALVEVPVGWR
jgi:hypothetical protein